MAQRAGEEAERGKGAEDIPWNCAATLGSWMCLLNIFKKLDGGCACTRACSPSLYVCMCVCVCARHIYNSAPTTIRAALDEREGGLREREG